MRRAGNYYGPLDVMISLYLGNNMRMDLLVRYAADLENEIDRVDREQRA